MSEVSYKSLGDAVERLREALVRLDAHRGSELYAPMRDSVLISFQFTYAHCRLMLERYLVSTGKDARGVRKMRLADVVQSAKERGLLKADWAIWLGFRETLNEISRAYNEVVSERIAAQAPAFLGEAQYLYEQLCASGQL